MVKTLYFVLAIFLFSTCQKEVLIFDADPSGNLKLPLFLKFDGKDCFFDAKSGVLKYSISKEDLVNFSPVTKFQEESEIILANTALLNNEVNKLGELELYKKYDLEVISGDERNNFTLFFTEIPTLRFVLHDPIVNEPKTLSRFTINYPEIDKKSVTNWAGVEHRGASTLRDDKKSFGLEVLSGKTTNSSMEVSLFDWKKNSKWTLNSMFKDRSRLRNKLSFDLWKSMSSELNNYAIESEFVEVFVNNELKGVYLFTEDHSKEFLDIVDESVFYEGVDNSEVTKFFELEEDQPNGAFWDDWEKLFPNPSENSKWEDFVDLSSLIVESSDDEFKAEIWNLIEIDNVIDYYLFVNLSGGSDNVGKNWHFLKHDSKSKFIIVPWDLDATWGRNASGAEVAPDRIISNGLFTRLEEVNPGGYKERLRARWGVLRAAQFSGERLTSLLSQNFIKLESFQVSITENKLWKAELDLGMEEAFMVSRLEARLSFLDDLFGF